MCNTIEVVNSDSILTPGPEYARSFSAWCEATRLMVEWGNTGRKNWSHDEFHNLCVEGTLFESAFSIFSIQRKFCTTEGKRLAMVPRAAQKGDIICAFLGAKTPFVLRPDGSGNYRLVGECYVRGLMCGESADLPGFMEKQEDIVLV